MRDELLPDRGRVTLLPSRRKKLGWLAFCALIAVVGAIMLANGDPSGVPAMVLFGLGAIGTAVTLHPRVSYLRLEPEGFQFRSLIRAGRFAWNEVEAFHPRSTPNPVAGKDLTHVVIDLAAEAPRRGGRFARGRATEMHDAYGLEAKELARLLTVWRKHYAGPERASEAVAISADREPRKQRWDRSTDSAAAPPITERAFLMMVDGRTASWAHPSVVAGALLLDLERRGCLEERDGAVVACDCDPGDALLEAARNAIARSSTSHDAKGWVKRLPSELGLLNANLARSLVHRGLLVERSHKRLGMFRRTRLHVAGVAPEEELDQRLQAAFRSASEPDEDECLLAALLLGDTVALVPEDPRYDAQVWLRDVLTGWMMGTADGVRGLQSAVLAAVDDALTSESGGRWRVF